MIDLLLVIPPVSGNSILDYQWEDYREYLGVGYIAAYLRAHDITVEILDTDNLDLSVEQSIQIILFRKPRILGFSVNCAQFTVTHSIIKKLRTLQFLSPIIVGGYYPTLSAEKILELCPEIDIVIRSEAEETILKYVRAILNGETDFYNTLNGITFRKGKMIVNTKSVELIKDLDTLPFPARDTLPLVLSKGGEAYIISSRGCYGNCSFCSIHTFYKNTTGKKYRFRSIKNICDEIEFLIEKFSIKELRIFDDNLFHPGKAGKKRVFSLGCEILKRQLNISYEIVCRANDVDEELFSFLKKTGLRAVLIGIESFNEKDLKMYGKNLSPYINQQAVRILDKLNIELLGSFIIFNMNTEFNDFYTNLNFFYSRLKRDTGRGLANCLLSTATILSMEEGTNIYQLYKDSLHSDIGYNYSIKNKAVDKLKKIVAYIQVCWSSLYLKLILLEKYWKRYLKQKDHTRKKYYRDNLNKLWYNLARLNLDIITDFCKYLSQSFTQNYSLLNSIIEQFYLHLNELMLQIKSLEKRYLPDNALFPQFLYYQFKHENNLFVYDINHSEIIQVSPVIYCLLQYFVNGSPEEVKRNLTKEFSHHEVNQALSWFDMQIGTGRFVYQKQEIKIPSFRMVKTYINMIINN